MLVKDTIALLGERFPNALVMTNAHLGPGGPTILFVNEVFEAMTGYERQTVLGQSPKMLQGRDTSSSTRKAFGHALRRHQSFAGCLTNYRQDGEAYLCAITVTPLIDCHGGLEGFLAVEEEVIRRRGRPLPGPLGRFQTLTGAPPLQNLEVFTKF